MRKTPFLKFIYSERATQYCKISIVDLTVTTQDKSMVEISQNFVAFSEYINFTRDSTVCKNYGKTWPTLRNLNPTTVSK